MAARSVGRGTHSVLTVKLKRSEPFGRPPLQWHMDCCKLQFQNVFWSRGPKNVGLLPSARNALSAATRRQIPICRLAAFGRFKEIQERKLSLRTRLGAGTRFVKEKFPPLLFDAWFFGVSHKVILSILWTIAYIILPTVMFYNTEKRKDGQHP